MQQQTGYRELTPEQRATYRAQQRTNLVDELSEIRSWSGKARPTVRANTAAINFIFDGAAAPISAGMRAQCRVGFTGRLVSAEIISDIAGSATIDIWFGTFTDYPNNLAQLYRTATIPTLTPSFPYKRSLDITNWYKNLQSNDILVCYVKTVSGGITSLTFALELKKLGAPGFGTAGLATSGGDTLVTSDGTDITDRS